MTREELTQEITNWRGIQQRLTFTREYDETTGVPILQGGQLPQEDVLALVGLVQR